MYLLVGLFVCSQKGLAPSDYIESKVTCYSSLVALYENNPEIYEMEKNRSGRSRVLREDDQEIFW